jgi:hypothetical protein
VEVYRILWLSMCVALGAIGTAAALVRAPAAVAFLLVVVGVVDCLLTVWLASGFWERRTGGRLRMLALNALIAGTTIGALLGYMSLLGWGVLLLAAAVLAGSPPALHASTRCLRSVRRPSAAQLDAVASSLAFASPESIYFRPLRFRPVGGLHELTDEQLCKRWRASCKEAQLSGVQHLDALTERQMCLDELERRNAGALTAWLASGPSAWGDPRPYLTGERVGSPTIDWDELTRNPGS